MQRCQVVSRTYSPVSRFFQLRLVATERMAYCLLLVVVLTSASLPRNPIRVMRFMVVVISFDLLPRVSGHEQEGGAAPNDQGGFVDVAPPRAAAPAPLP